MTSCGINLPGSMSSEISLEDSLKISPKNIDRHASHVMLYAKWPGALFGKYPFHYAIMMQFRYDGTLGFPGGLLDEGETPEEAASREMLEELGGGVIIERDDHVMTSYSKFTKSCLHFYAKELSLENFNEIESGVTKTKDWGTEVFGLLRPPLYTLPGGFGLPAFLGNKFIGNCRIQLLETIKRRGLLTPEEVEVASNGILD